MKKMSIEENSHNENKDRALCLEEGFIEELQCPNGDRLFQKDMTTATLPKVEVIKVILEEEDISSNRHTGIKREHQSEIYGIPDLPFVDTELFENIWVKNYSLIFVNEEPIDDVTTLFKDNPLDYERLQLHQRVFNTVLENQNESETTGDLQGKYMAQLGKESDIKVFNCSLQSCEYQTMNKTNLKSHLMLVHKMDLKLKMLKCKICLYLTESLPDLKKHMYTTHQITQPENYNYMEMPHSYKSLLEGTCSPEFNNIIRTNVKMNAMKCSLCTYQTENKSLFLEHEASHKCSSNPRNYCCYVCCYKTKTKLFLKRHLLKMHQIKTLGFNRLKPHKCHLCGFTTASHRLLYNHAFTHTLPSLKCTKCDFKTKYKRSLTLHMETHKPPDQVVRKHTCEICSKQFRTSSKLNFHALTHKSIDEVDQVFQCHLCKYRTKFKVYLKIHMQVHKEYRYKCEICGYKQHRKWNYENHLLTHQDPSEIITYKCNLCAYQTNFKVRLERHMRKGDHTRNYANSDVRKIKTEPAELFRCGDCGKETRVKAEHTKDNMTQWMFCVKCCKITNTKKVVVGN